MDHSAYAELLDLLEKAARLGEVQSLLHWDEQVNLPPDSRDARAAQSATVSDLLHRASTDPKIGSLLNRLEAERDSLPAEARAVVREARRDYDLLVRLPDDFAARKARLDSRAFHAWAEAREASDFARFAPWLEQQLEMAREQASHCGYSENPYDLMIDLHDPGMTAAAVETLFTPLRRELPELLERILASPVRPPEGIFRGFPVDRQRSFLEGVVTRMGFDYRRGRIDVSLHPFCSGRGTDIRMTTRFHPDNPLDSLFSSIHETGHGLYEQGLPAEPAGTALTINAGMAVHESQSRLWENQICRSRPAWAFFEPRFREAFPEQLARISSEDLYLAINAVSRNPIRVDADEVTYNLHIILRFDLERRLFAGKLAVRDLPEAWNESTRALLGMTPKNDAEGVLQDVHWSGGAFGYFPSYCLGNMIAAQLHLALRESLPNLDALLREGEFAPVLAWLRERVHRHARTLPLPELVRQASGRDLGPQALIDYLRDRYLPLYS